MPLDATRAPETPRKASFADVVAPEDIVWAGDLPMPPAPPVRPLHAFQSVLKLIRNKEDTRQVFETVAALAGRSGHRLFRQFASTDYGRRVLSGEVKLEQVLSNREWLRSLPDGSLGRAYLDFMEGENLTPEGLLAAAEEAGIDLQSETQFEEYRRMFIHLDVCHDLWHVLTGYGRDALGELCNLGFTRGQTYNPGFRLIIWLGLIAQKIEQPSQPLWKAVSEGREMGRGVDFLLQHDVEDLLVQPIDEVRRKLNFIEPRAYKAVPDGIKANLLKPRVKETQAERETLADAQT